ncbi:apoptosis inhibitor cassowary [Lycorma delicatula]|uniref:apoptosis inhibitor cassowary n=1 Tax=Lycorma delicatula TaxID=130591 RepID=UPI003F513BE6
MTADDCIQKLYKNFGILADAKEKIGEHEKEYLEILTAVKGSAKEKRLASQFIARFFKHFPTLADQAIEAQLDLCEDEDISIRKQAIKDLPNLCKDNKEHTQKIADILAQLLQAEDQSELSVVQNSLMTLFKIDAKGSLGGLFSQILNGEDAVRERCLKFLSVKLKALGHDVINKGAEDYLISESKKVLQDVTADEFHILMDLLAWTRLGQSTAGQKEIVEIVAEQAELESEFIPTDEDHVDRLIHSVRHALPYFSAHIDSVKFVTYMCQQVLPVLSKITSSEEGSDPQLDVLKLFAELCAHCYSETNNPSSLNSSTSSPESLTESVYKCLNNYMPLPPSGDDDTPEPRLEFSYVECLIYSLHRLARFCPEFLVKDPDKLKDFRLRLQYFARGIQGYIKKLREALQGKTGDELKTEENKIKVVALKTTSNINTLIKDLFHSPPSFKSTISLSWKPTSLSALTKDSNREGVAGQKRHTPITFSDSASSQKQSRSESKGSTRELYTPPSGKYSNKVSSYTPPAMRGRGRGGRMGGGGWSRGSFRGGNRGWRRVSY